MKMSLWYNILVLIIILLYKVYTFKKVGSYFAYFTIFVEKYALAKEGIKDEV